MHVLIVSAWDPTSGVLTVYRALARHLGPRGVSFSAFAFDGWRRDSWWTFCDELIDGRSTTLAEVLMSGKYDLVHCVDTAYSSPYGVEKWVHRARFRGPVVLMAQVARKELAEPAHATHYVACSRDAADVLAEDADGPVVVITNGYDERVFRPGAVDGSEPPLLVWVGRSNDPQKDVDLFLDAVESLPEYEAVLVDTDAEGRALQSRLSRIGPRVRRRTLLASTQMAEVYRAAAVSGGAFLSTSRYEGFPHAATESMACGCPIVVPGVPGHGHLIDGVNALVYDRSSGVSGISRALDRLQDPAFKAGLVERAARQAAEDWTSRSMADSYMHLYTEALASTAALRRPVLRDTMARAMWRLALTVRPTWHRARHLVRG